MTVPVWTQIEEAVKDIPGWSPIDQLYSLFTLVTFASPTEGDILEIGSWCGRSAVILGRAARELDAHLHCVDLFPEKEDWYQNNDRTWSFRVKVDGKSIGSYELQTVWKEPFENQILPLYEKYGSVRKVFDKSIETHSLKEFVTAKKGDMEVFSKTCPQNLKLRMAFIDGDHGYVAVCNDIRAVDKYLLPGGIICFDDAFSSYEGVDRAITELIINNPAYTVKKQMARKFFVAKKGN